MATKITSEQIEAALNLLAGQSDVLVAAVDVLLEGDGTEVVDDDNILALKRLRRRLWSLQSEPGTREALRDAIGFAGAMLAGGWRK